MSGLNRHAARDSRANGGLSEVALSPMSGGFIFFMKSDMSPNRWNV
jgi:hypothetical protein